MNNIHTYGDSHSKYGWERITSRIININHVGPRLCYTFGNSELKESLPPLLNNDIIVFCFGEIDCRCHIHKYVTVNNSYEDVINKIVQNYFIKIKETTKQFEEKINICVYNVAPPAADTTAADPNLLRLGSFEDRKKYTKYFNTKLKQFSDIYSYHFFDIYSLCEGARGEIKKEASNDGVHITNPTYIEKHLNLITLS